jgi:hypothetical protein
MNMMNTSLKSIILEAQVSKLGEGYLAMVPNLPLSSMGSTKKNAEDQLAIEFKNWALNCEEKGILGSILAAAGYGVLDEDTEICLTFSE